MIMSKLTKRIIAGVLVGVSLLITSCVKDKVENQKYINYESKKPDLSNININESTTQEQNNNIKEPKFQVGDKVVSIDDESYWITEIYEYDSYNDKYRITNNLSSVEDTWVSEEEIKTPEYNTSLEYFDNTIGRSTNALYDYDLYKEYVDGTLEGYNYYEGIVTTESSCLWCYGSDPSFESSWEEVFLVEYQLEDGNYRIIEVTGFGMNDSELEYFRNKIETKEPIKFYGKLFKMSGAKFSNVFDYAINIRDIIYE